MAGQSRGKIVKDGRNCCTLENCFMFLLIYPFFWMRKRKFVLFIIYVYFFEREREKGMMVKVKKKEEGEKMVKEG